MYLFTGIFLFFCIVFCSCVQRRYRIIKKIISMNRMEKLRIIHDLSSPFGFVYREDQDIFTTRRDAWQKDYGYTGAFDLAAPAFGMVFDCEPVFFDYNGKTWLIEFWKGQYGLTAGGEVGLYYADALLAPDRRQTAHFHAVSDEEMMPLSIMLQKNGRPMFAVHEIHWWLTGFRLGTYCEPSDLKMEVSITFPEMEMLRAFCDSLIKNGYDLRSLCTCDCTVSLLFTAPHSTCSGFRHHLYTQIARRKNRLFCQLYLNFTRPFTDTVDRLLCLYYFFPAGLRSIRRCQKGRKRA